MVLDDTLLGKGKIPVQLAAVHLLVLTLVNESKQSVKLFLVNLEVLGKACGLNGHRKGSKLALHPHRQSALPRALQK